jgi:serine/threonine-protein kinase
VHRDLKPENIFLHRREESGVTVKVVDFGIAKLMESSWRASIDKPVTSSGAMVGTPQYMAPEQALGQGAQVGPSSDVWAFGLIAYRLLAGAPYWRARTLADLVKEMTSRVLEPPSSKTTWLPRALGLVVEEVRPGAPAPSTLVETSLWSSLALTTTDPAGGGDSMPGMQTSDLAATLERVTESAGGPGPAKAASRRHRRLFTAGAAAVAVVVGALGVLAGVLATNRARERVSTATAWGSAIRWPQASVASIQSATGAGTEAGSSLSGSAPSASVEPVAGPGRTRGVGTARSAEAGPKASPMPKTSAPFSPDMP